MTLPWKPIAELPVGPDKARRFLIDDVAYPIRFAKLNLYYWNGLFWSSDDDRGRTDAGIREDCTHFIEITPP